MSVLKLGYWNIRGLAQSSRFLLEYLNIPYIDELYVQAGPNAPIPFDKSCWFNVKQQLPLDFPNLPYLIDNDLKLTQSQCILRHIARKKPELNLLGNNVNDMAKVDMLLGEISDKKGKMVTLQYEFGLNDVGLDFIKGDDSDDLKFHLKQFENYLQNNQNHNYFVGNNITIVDFFMYEYLTQAFYYSQSIGLNYRELYPLLNNYCIQFENLPSIKNYLNSEKFKLAVSGFNNQHAKFR